VQPISRSVPIRSPTNRSLDGEEPEAPKPLKLTKKFPSRLRARIERLKCRLSPKEIEEGTKKME
jgi:hypothetical protein